MSHHEVALNTKQLEKAKELATPHNRVWVKDSIGYGLVALRYEVDGRTYETSLVNVHGEVVHVR